MGDVLMRLQPFKTALITTFFSTMIFSTSYADEPAPTAGAEEARFKAEDFLEEKAPSKEELDPEEGEAGPTPIAEDAQMAGPTVTIKSVKFSGNQIISSERLQPLVKDIIGKPVTMAEIHDAVSRVKKHYRQKGNLASYVYLPEQRLQDPVDTLTIEVIEGTVEDVSVSGNKYFSSDLIKRLLDIQPNQPLIYNYLRSRLVRLNKLRDIDARSVLKPGSKTGTTDLEIEVQDRSPAHLSVDANNLGTKNTGEYRFGVLAEHNNFYGRADSLSSRMQFGKETFAASGDYNFPLNDAWGTRMGLDISYADLEVKGEFAPLQIKGDALTYGAYITQPWSWDWLWDNLDSTLRLGFQGKSIENKTLGVVSGKDEYRILKPGITFERTDRYGKTISPHEFNIGFSSFLGASDKVDAQATRAGTGGQFAYYRGALYRYHWLTRGILLVLKGTLQLTPDRLGPSEQIRIGGAQSVRGYTEGEYLGDYGGYGSVEAHIPTYFFPADWKFPYSKEPLRQQVQLVGFVDGGYAGVKHALAGERKNRDIAGAGVGVRVHLWDKFYGRVEWGFPIGSTPTDNRSSAFYFGVSYEIF